ncbi:hypothetical protein EBU71_22395, partial [bacterium]|nr:hypothetical protein [Candidatus Elulimicrobium humile]
CRSQDHLSASTEPEEYLPLLYEEDNWNTTPELLENLEALESLRYHTLNEKADELFFMPEKRCRIPDSHMETIAKRFGITSLYVNEPMQHDSLMYRRKAIDNDHYFVGLDLDECSLLGADTNNVLDLGFIAKHFHLNMPRYTEPTMQETYKKQQLSEGETNKFLFQLAENVVNPGLLQAMDQIREKVGHQPYVFAYTNKCVLVDEYAEYLKVYIDSNSCLFYRAILGQFYRIPDKFHNLDQQDFLLQRNHH